MGTVDNVVTYFYSHGLEKTVTPEGQRVRNFMQQQPACLNKILQLMLQLVMSGEFNSTWSISRPLMGLILIHENDFVALKEQIIASQIEEKRQKLRGFFDELMAGVENNLSTKNKDHFTRNLYNFAQVVRTIN